MKCVDRFSIFTEPISTLILSVSVPNSQFHTEQILSVSEVNSTIRSNKACIHFAHASAADQGGGFTHPASLLDDHYRIM